MKRFYFILIAALLIQIISANTEKIILEVTSRDDITCDLQFTQLNKFKNAPSLVPPFSEIQNSLIPKNKANNTATIHWYQLNDLKDGAKYEVRISYPAITPADFQLKILNKCKTENNLWSYTLQLSAEYTGVSNLKGIEFQPVTYNLVLETLYFGFLFYQAYKIVIAILLVLCIGQFLLVPYIRNLIKKEVDKND